MRTDLHIKRGCLCSQGTSSLCSLRLYLSDNGIFQNYAHILRKQLTLSGFFVSDLAPKYFQQFMQDIPPRVARGEIKFTEDKRRGLESVGQLTYDVQAGKNRGKAVIVVADDD